MNSNINEFKYQISIKISRERSQNTQEKRRNHLHHRFKKVRGLKMLKNYFAIFMVNFIGKTPFC